MENRNTGVGQNNANPAEQQEGAGQNQHANNSNRRTAAEVAIPAPPQRRRVELESHTAGNTISQRYLNSLSEISVHELLADNNDVEDLDSRYVTLQLLRIITQNANANAVVKNRFHKGYNNRQTQNVQYSRLYLCRVVSDYSSENSSVMYVMQSKDDNVKLWRRYTDLRDSGYLTIGSIFRMVHPQPIDKEIGGIPLLVAEASAIVNIPPKSLRTCAINRSIAGDQCLAYTLNSKQIKVLSSYVVETGCGGYFCDKQRANELKARTDIKNTCGCFAVLSQRSGLAVSHSMKVEKADDENPIRHSNFSSTKFKRLYMNGPLQGNIKEQTFEGTNTYMDLKDSIKDVVQFINDNGGFTILGWYRRGIITDKLMAGITEETYTTEGDITFHIVSVSPTNKNLLDPTHHLGVALRARQFSVNTLNDM